MTFCQVAYYPSLEEKVNRNVETSKRRCVSLYPVQNQKGAMPGEKAQKVKQELHLTLWNIATTFAIGTPPEHLVTSRYPYPPPEFPGPTAEAGFKQRRMHELAHWHAVLGESSIVRIKLNALSAAGAQIGHKPQTQVH